MPVSCYTPLQWFTACSVSLSHWLLLQWAFQSWVKGNKTCYFPHNTEEDLLEEECHHETIFSDHCGKDLTELFKAVVKSFSISRKKSKITSNHNHLSFSCWAEEWVLDVNTGPGFLWALPSSSCDWADDKRCCLVRHHKFQYLCWSLPSLLNPRPFQHDSCSRN